MPPKVTKFDEMFGAEPGAAGAGGADTAEPTGDGGAETAADKINEGSAKEETRQGGKGGQRRSGGRAAPPGADEPSGVRAPVGRKPGTAGQIDPAARRALSMLASGLARTALAVSAAYDRAAEREQEWTDGVANARTAALALGVPDQAIDQAIEQAAVAAGIEALARNAADTTARTGARR